TYIRSRLAQPYRPSRFLRALGLGLRFSYWIPFSVPVLAPAVMRSGFARRVQDIDSPGAPKHRSEQFDVDAANSLKIYRANAFGSVARVSTDHYVSVPVQLICSGRDPVIRGHGYDDEARWVPRLWRRDIKA